MLKVLDVPAGRSGLLPLFFSTMKTLATLLLTLLCATTAWSQSPTIYTVTTIQDGLAMGATLGTDRTCDDTDMGTTGVQCSLRQAIAEANATSGAVIINVPGQLMGGMSGAYSLNANTSPAIDTYEDANQFGDLDIGGSGAAFSSLTIRGTGTPGPSISQAVGALGGDRLFHVLDGTTAQVRFERMSLTGGQARPGRNGSSDGSGVGVDGEDGADGGAILVGMGANVVIDQVSFSGNATQPGGNGAAPATGDARTEGGSAGDGGDGGALYVSMGATVTVRRSTFSGNSTGDGGGGANGQANSGAARGGNGGDGGNGGAIYSAGTLTVDESTLAENTLGDPSQGGGGVNGGASGYAGSGGSGGGIATAQRPETETVGSGSAPADANEGTATLRNTIVASNSAGDATTNGKQPGSDLYDASSGSTFTTQGYNLVGTNDAVSNTFAASADETTYNANNDLVGTGQQSTSSRINPDLGSLNGNADEAVPTRPLLASSPAVNRGIGTRNGGEAIRIDGRGFLRPGTASGDATVDIGAYEFMSRAPSDSLAINEYDAVTAMDNSEFVEIANLGEFPVQLADYALVLFDRDETACYAVNLRGELAPGSTYTIGDDGVPNVLQSFDEGFAYESCPPSDGTAGEVDANTLDDTFGAIALYKGQASSYPDGAAAGQNATTRETVVVYDNTGAAQSVARGVSSMRMDANSLCTAFGLGSGCASSGDTESESIQRQPDGSYAAGTPNSGVLPVELTAFAATLDGDRVRLEWATQSETNNAGFAIERSTESTTWTSIAFVAGAGTTLEAQQYAFVDIDAAFETATIRYRLRQTDLDGAVTYGPVVEIALETPSTDAVTGVWPMPVTERAEVRLTLARDGDVRVALYDVLGRQVALLRDGYESAGHMRIALDATSLAAGTYFVRVVTERSTLTEQITLAR